MSRLGYLSLDRVSSTLSGGEAQRVKMVRHLGSSLTDVSYVFDEPTIGLQTAQPISMASFRRHVVALGRRVVDR